MDSTLKSLLLVLDRHCVSRSAAASLCQPLLDRGFDALILSVNRAGGIPVEVHDLSALTPTDRDTVEQIVREYAGRSLDQGD